MQRLAESTNLFEAITTEYPSLKKRVYYSQIRNNKCQLKITKEKDEKKNTQQNVKTTLEIDF